ncbi:MAG: ATP-binding cassette domain-containing protein [Candidatus Caldarchaeum sp.]|nr:ATP-binding cassette domain-containing protein [Candidatus Caldarchaeum sp.]
MKAVEVEGLVKRFGQLVAVDNVSFTVEEGELFGFLGPNGAGKTTTINILTTLIRPTSGKAFVAGYDVSKQPSKVRQAVGLVPQEITVDDDLTGRENLMLQAGLYHLTREQARKTIEELLELVGLSEVADKRVETYSGGMRKRLDLAAGLIHRPRILFLDEPTLGLDVATRAAIWSYIKRLRSEAGVTVFMTTHYMDEADALCDRIAIIDRGRIKAVDKPVNLKNSLGGDVVELEVVDGGRSVAEIVEKISGVKRVAVVDGLYRLTVERGDKALPLIVEALVRNDVKVQRIMLKTPTLDEVFLEYTGRKLREEAGSWEESFRRRHVLRRARAV